MPLRHSDCIPKSTGKERDNESNLDNFGARYFTSNMGRFMSPDPSSALVLKAINPQRWNGYAYALDSPLSYTDPTGEDAAAVNFGSMVGGQGHEALLIVDQDGTTTFASFGPTSHGISNDFGANGKGLVTVAQDTSTGMSLLPTVQFGANGLPTPESYKALVTALAKIEGVDPATVRLNYFKTSEADTQSLKAWVDQQRNLVNSLGAGSGFCCYNVGFSNCADFTVAGLFEGGALSQQQVGSLSMGFRPNSLFNELQPYENDEFDLLDLQLKQHWCVSSSGYSWCGYAERDADTCKFADYRGRVFFEHAYDPCDGKPPLTNEKLRLRSEGGIWILRLQDGTLLFQTPCPLRHGTGVGSRP